jgi:FtsH-binding integral membrane protein
MDYTKMNYGTQSKSQVDQGLRSYMIAVYNYMAAALGISGIAAYAVASSTALSNLLFGTPLMWVVLFAPLVMVWFVMPRIMNMSLSSAQFCFWTYAALVGLSLAPIFEVYAEASIAKVFFISASVFGSMSIYGYTTKKDLSGWGSFLFIGLIGVIVASLVNIFLQSSDMDFVISIIAVMVFVGLTAYDTQNIKENYYRVAGMGDAASKFAIFGALSLYLDFINLFVSLLRLFGERK